MRGSTRPTNRPDAFSVPEQTQGGTGGFLSRHLMTNLCRFIIIIIIIIATIIVIFRFSVLAVKMIMMGPTNIGMDMK